MSLGLRILHSQLVEKCDVSSQCGRGISLFQGPKQRERERAILFQEALSSFMALSHSPLVKKTSP